MSLADERVVYSLFFQAVEVQIDTAEMLLRGTLSPKQATDRGLVLIDRLARVFSGNDSEFVPVPGWNGPTLGRSLRCALAHALISLSDEDRELFSDDQSVIVYALSCFAGEVQDLMEHLSAHGSEMTESDARAYHTLCMKWTRRFLPPGSAKSNP